MRTITDDIIIGFKIYMYEEEKSSNTIEKYMRDVRFFYEWLNGRCINKSIVLEYKNELCGKYAPKSVNSILSSLNALFVYMKWYDCKVKTLKIQRQIFADKEKELTKSEYEKLLEVSKRENNNRLYYLIQTLGCTGIRISELKYMTCEVVNTGYAVINSKGKIRKVFLSKQLCKMLRFYMKQQQLNSGPIFVSKNGKPLDRSNIWKMLKNLCEIAHVDKKKVFPHNFRHLFAKTFYSLRKDIVRLADVLGHSSIETTRIYTIESGEIHEIQMQELGRLLCDKKRTT